MHKSQVLFYLLLAFLAGVFTASMSNLTQSFILVLFIAGICAIAVFGYQKTFSQKGILAGALILVFAFGVFRFNYFNLTRSLLSEFSDKEAGGKGIPVVLGGFVNGQKDINGSKSNFKFAVREIVLPDRKLKVAEDILVTTNSYPEYEFGRELSLSAVLKTPKNFDLSGQKDFDYITYLKKEGIRIVTSYPTISPAPDLNLGWRDNFKIFLYGYLFKIKDRFEKAVNLSIPEPNASFVNGILLGSRQNIPEDLKNAFAKTSTTHILAISGYNITIISEYLLALLVVFMRRRKAFWISVLAIILFTILTGASSSVVRASIMGLLLLFANGYGRLYDVKNSIILAGAAMVYLNPFVLNFDVGFQLSFLAVLGLVYLYPVLDRKFKKISNLGKIKETFLMSLSAQLFVAPLLVYYFNNFSLVSLPANILVLPFVPYAMGLGFVTGIAGMILIQLGRIIGFLAWAVTAYQIKIIEYLGSLSFASVSGLVSWLVLVLVYVVLFWSLNSNESKKES